MASILHRQSAEKRQDLQSDDVVAVIDASEFEEAQRDPRVRRFLDEADAYLADLEQQGRNL